MPALLCTRAVDSTLLAKRIFLLQEHSILRYLHSRTVVLLYHCSHLIQNDAYRERSKNSTVGGLIIIKSLPGDSHGPLVQLRPIAALSSRAIPLSASAPTSTLTPPSPFIHVGLCPRSFVTSARKVKGQRSGQCPTLRDTPGRRPGLTMLRLGHGLHALIPRLPGPM